MELNELSQTPTLQELNGSDFEIKDHQPDISGWEIVDGNGHELGEVRDLVFDTAEQKVRYIVSHIDVDIDHDGDDELKLVLIPIGIVDLDERQDKVIVPQRYALYIDNLPAYEPGHIITPGEELAVRQAFLGTENAITDYNNRPADFYSHEHFDDTRFTKRTSDTNNISDGELL